MYYDDDENNTNTGTGDNSTPQEDYQAPVSEVPEEDPQPSSDLSADNNSSYFNNMDNMNNAYENLNEQDYKENIRQMKKEYRQFQKDKKRTAQEQYNAPQYSGGHYTKRGIGAGTSFVLAILTSFIVFVVIFALLAYFPTKSKSFLSSFYNGSSKSSNGETNNPSGNDVQIGDNTISKGDNVTINVNGDSEIAKAVYAKAANSVVGIAVTQVSGSKWNQAETTVSMGSGIVYSADGIIVTNCHVVESAINDTTRKLDENFKVRVYFKTDLSEWAYAELIGYDASNDIAVLRVGAQNLQPVEFADSDTLQTGETAITIGSPGGLSYMNSISEGILSGTNRTVTTNNETVYDLIQTTAAINPGNSGGALLNKEGKLIGLCVIKIVSTEYEGMGFAINSNTVKTIVESIKEYGYYNKPLLGITINTSYSSTIADKQGWKRGAYIENTSANSASDKAGLKADDIITKINDSQVSSFAELRRVLLKFKPGDKINIEVFRSGSGETMNFEVILDETPKPIN